MPTTLIVDDDPHIRTWLRCILEGKGYQVHEADNGEAAQAFLKQEVPDLIVVDIFLPGKNGLDVILYARSCSHASKILAISGSLINGARMCETAMVLGAHDALAKPFSPEQFLRRVETLLPKP